MAHAAAADSFERIVLDAMTATRTRRAAREEEANNSELLRVDSRHHSSEAHKRQRSASAPEERKARKTSKRSRPRSSDVSTSPTATSEPNGCLRPDELDIRLCPK